MPTHNLYQGRQRQLYPAPDGFMPQIIEVAARALIVKDGRVLLVKHEGGVTDGWYIPGGRIVPGENLKDAAMREVVEETGLTAKIGDLLFMFDSLTTTENSHRYEFVFLATPVGEVDFADKACIDQDELGAVTSLRWFTVDELKATPRVFPPFLADYLVVQAALLQPTMKPRYHGYRVQEGAPADFALDRFYVSARAVTLQDDKLLLVRNKKSDWWYGAGGGIELAEDIFAAAEREVQEETGIAVKATDVLAVDEFYSHTARIHQINIYTACQPVRPQEITPEWEDPAGYVGEARFFSADEFRQHPRAFPPHLFNIAWPHLTGSEGETK